MAYEGPLGWLVSRPIAHRGLHDGNVDVMENSLSSCRAAIVGKFAIECDVVLTRDRVPIIFHDMTLERLTMASGKVSDWSWEEISALVLGNTKATIPTVRQFLSIVGGQVPVVMELKGTSPADDEDFLEVLLPFLRTYSAQYSGPLALMSFDPWLIDQAIAAKEYPVGLTAEGLRPEMWEEHRAVYERGCAFVSYNVQHLPNPFTDWVRNERRDPVISWTVKSREDLARTRAHADQMTFEGFVPQG